MLTNLEDQEKYKHPFNVPVFGKYGAPMGRPNTQGPENIHIKFAVFYERVKFHCVKVPFFDSAYDKGGAYWGMGLPIYCIHAFLHIDGTTNNYNAQFFTRAQNRDQAKDHAKRYFSKSMTFYR